MMVVIIMVMMVMEGEGTGRKSPVTCDPTPN
jgi:hypothetical protein